MAVCHPMVEQYAALLSHGMVVCRTAVQPSNGMPKAPNSGKCAEGLNTVRPCAKGLYSQGLNAKGLNTKGLNAKGLTVRTAFLFDGICDCPI